MESRVFEDKVLSLSDRIYPMVVRMLGNRENAEDAVQEIMLKLWDQRHKIANHPNIPGFVILTTRNYCIDLLKKKNPNIHSAELPLDLLASDKSNDRVEWKELTGLVDNILKELPAQQCEIMMMRDIDGFEFVEIVAATKLKLEHVRVLLSRARKQVSVKLMEIHSYE